MTEGSALEASRVQETSHRRCPIVAFQVASTKITVSRRASCGVLPSAPLLGEGIGLNMLVLRMVDFDEIGLLG